MTRRVNKRGQVESNTIIYLLIAVAVLAVVVLGFMFGWDKIFGWLNAAPGDLEKAAQACGLAAQNNLVTTYCNDLRELDVLGKKQYVNCEFLATNHLANFTALESGCGGDTQIKPLAKVLCENKKLNNETDYVNGQTCKFWRDPAP